MVRLLFFFTFSLFSATTFSAERMTYYSHFLTTMDASTLITTEGLDGQNTKFIVNKVAINVFQDCTVLQYGAFRKMGGCGAYKTGAQLWQRPAQTNVNNGGISVVVYPTSTPSSVIYATPNMEYFIVGNPASYAWQDCTAANSVNYALVSPCTSGLVLWKRITPIN